MESEPGVRKREKKGEGKNTYDGSSLCLAFAFGAGGGSLNHLVLLF
jgi:hypothetical protein